MATWGGAPWGTTVWGASGSGGDLEVNSIELYLEMLGAENGSDPDTEELAASVEFGVEILGPDELPPYLPDVLPPYLELAVEILGPLPPAIVLPPDPSSAGYPVQMAMDGATDITAISARPVMNDKGTASVTAKVVPVAGAEVSVRVGAQYALEGRVISSEIDKVESSEHGVVYQAAIEGHLREWDQSVVFPDFAYGGSEGFSLGGMDDRLGSPAQDTRFFDWTMNGGVTNAQVTAPVYGRDPIQAALEKAAVRLNLPDNWPHEFGNWMWAGSKPGLTAAGWTTYRAVTKPGTGMTSWWLCVYDYGELWVDGVQILTADQAGKSVSIKMEASPYNHLVCIRAHNGGGAGGVMFAAMPVKGSTFAEPILTSSGGWRGSVTQNPAPLTVGQALQRLLDEAKERGELTGWTVNVGPNADSAGNPWPIQTASLQADVGMTYREVLDRWAEGIFDFWAVGRSLYAVLKNTSQGSYPNPWAQGVDLLSRGTEGSIW